MISSRWAAFALSLALCLLLCPCSRAMPISLEKRGWPFKSIQMPSLPKLNLGIRIRNFGRVPSVSNARSNLGVNDLATGIVPSGPDWTAPRPRQVHGIILEHKGSLWSPTRGMLPGSRAEVDASNPYARWYTKDKHGNWIAWKVENGREVGVKIFESSIQDWTPPSTSSGPSWGDRDPGNLDDNDYLEHNGYLWSRTNGRLPTSPTQVDIRNPGARWYKKDMFGFWKKYKMLNGVEVSREVYGPLILGMSNLDLRSDRPQRPASPNPLSPRLLNRVEELSTARQEPRYSPDPTIGVTRPVSLPAILPPSRPRGAATGMEHAGQPSGGPRQIAVPVSRQKNPNPLAPINSPGSSEFE
ncbi:hypothetical protein CDD81_190 [Ophiocordyceps australis]|uniref:GH16 domain-containing protein n=1 Tax=Ophiocordyceps australis TaxID=1399860 RepID=A0A2C5YBP0_9HYPO|nr:hypothetical protein CDD81_190 [Ophiocordyceps australis]